MDFSFWDERRLVLFSRSLTLALLGAALALILGLLAAYFLWNRKRPVWFSAVLILALPLSPMMYVYSLEYIYGLFNLKTAPQLSIIISYSLQLLPLNALAIYNGFLSVSSTEIDAARVLRSDYACLFQVIIRRNLPLMLILVLFSTVMNLLDYSIPALFGVSVYSLDIFAVFSATGDVLRVALQSLPVFILSLSTFIVLLILLRSVWSVNPQGNTGRCFGQSKNIALTISEAFGCIVCLLPLLAVLSALAPLLINSQVFLTAVSTSLGDLSYSLRISALAAIFGTALAVGFRAFGGALLPFALLFAAMPPALVGILLLYTLSSFRVLDSIMPVIALILRFFPFAAVLLYMAKRLENKDENRAALLFARTKTVWLFRYKLPVMLPSLLISATIIFVLSLGEIGATLLVIPPGSNTLTIKLYNYMHYGSGASVSGLASLLGVTVALITAAAWGLWRYLKRSQREIYD